MGLPAISGLIGGILAVIAGIIVLVKPKVLAWVVGIYLIVFGIFAIMAMSRLSCSVCEEWGPGSSALTTTNPPFTPRYAALINGSDATFKPTCFMLTAARRPAILAV